MDALDLGTGAVRWRHPIDLPNSDVLQQLSRPAIALTNGRAYASFGGRAGDCGLFHGFVLGVSTDGTSPDLFFQAGPARAAIWAPGGPVVMPDGDLLVSTGNTDEHKQYDGNNAVDRLSPSLTLRDFLRPHQLEASEPGRLRPRQCRADRDRRRQGLPGGQGRDRLSAGR